MWRDQRRQRMGRTPRGLPCCSRRTWFTWPRSSSCSPKSDVGRFCPDCERSAAFGSDRALSTETRLTNLVACLADGATNFRWLGARAHFSSTPLTIGVLLILLMYLMDTRLWTGAKAVPKMILFAAAGICIFLGVLFMFNMKPWLPLAFGVLFQPGYHTIVKSILFSDMPMKSYMRCMKVATFIAAVVTCIVFLMYSHHNDFWWGTQSRLDFINRLTNTSKTEAGKCDLAHNLTDPGATEHGPCPCTCEDCPALCDVGRNAGTESLYDTVVAQDSPCYCLAGFMLWGSAGMFSFAMLAYAALYSILSSTTEGGSGAQIFVGFMIVSGITLWMAGTLMGTAMGASSAVSGVFGVFCIQAVLLVDKAIGREAMKDQFMSVAILKAMAGSLESKLGDWFRAMFMMLIFPTVFLPLVVLSVINQFFRKMGLGMELEPGEKTLTLTKRFSDLVRNMQTDWNWTSILNKICLIATAYFALSIAVAKLAVVFLSWMNESLETTSLALVCLAYVFVGEFMFCNPLIPATPVYLTGGIVVVRSAERLLSGCVATSEMLSRVRAGAWATYNAAKYASSNPNPVAEIDHPEGLPLYHTCIPHDQPGGEDGCYNISAATCWLPGMRENEHGVRPEETNMLCFCNSKNGGTDLHDNFWSAIVFASIITFILKMCAIFLEQVVIGMNLGKKLVVRQFVQVNSTEMRAIRVLLEVPGLNWKKCVILLGGPDWPTSVLTGILRLSVFQCLLGSSPFIILNTPTVIGGSLQLRRAEGDMWATLANVGFAMSALTQGSATSLCTYYIFDTADKRRAELEAMPDDEEVKALEEKSAREAAFYAAATEWKTKVPGNIKAVLFLASVLCGSFFFMSTLLGSQCWVSVDVADPISGPPLYGNWFGWLQPMGYFALGLYAAGVVLMRVFQKWGTQQAQLAMARSGEAPAREVELVTTAPLPGGSAANSSYTPPELSGDMEVQPTGNAMEV